MRCRPPLNSHQFAAVLLVGLALVACAGDGRRPSERPHRDGPAPVSGLERAWRWSPPREANLGMPVADAEGVAVTYNHTYLALVGPDGLSRWEADRLGLRDVAPALTADLVLAATDEGVAAFDRRTGRARWDVALGGRASAPVVAGDRALVTLEDGALAAVTLADGGVAWRLPLPGPVLGPPAAAGDVIVASWDGDGRAGVATVDVATGRLRWSADLPPGGVSAPAVAPGALAVVVAGDAAAHALSLDDGHQRWRAPLGGAGSPEVPPLAVDRMLVVADRQGVLHQLRPRDGGEVWHVAGGEAAVRGGPAGPGPGGAFAVPQWDGGVLVARPGGRATRLRPPGGLAAGVAVGPSGELLVTTAQGDGGALVAYRGW